MAVVVFKATKITFYSHRKRRKKTTEKRRGTNMEKQKIKKKR